MIGMRIPVVQGVIERRILLNWRVRPEAIAPQLPPPFRPKLIRGWAIGGVCLIRLSQVRPRGLPAILGVASENAAHRIAVQWDTPEGIAEGVYIPRRDTNSCFNTLVGGKLFPGEHHHAQFRVAETPERLEVELHSDDGQTHVHIAGQVAKDLPNDSIFALLDEASAFFEAGALGYSATSSPHELDGLELRCRRWQIEPLSIERAASSFFDDRARFPAGSTQLDCALLMRNIEHEWHSRESLCCDTSVARSAP